MSASTTTIQAVSTLLAADPNVSPTFRLAVMEALANGEAVNLEGARQLLNVGRTTFWRMRRDGRVNLSRVAHPNAKEVRVSLSSVVKSKGES